MYIARLHIAPLRILLWLLCLLVPVAVWAAPDPLKQWYNAPPQEADNPAAMLNIGNRDVVKFRANIGTATPMDRVHAAEEKIEQLSDADLGRPISINEAKLGDVPGLAIYVGPVKLFGLLDADVDPLSDRSLQEEADLVAGNLSSALKSVQQQRKPEIMLRGAALSMAAILLFMLAAWLIMRIRARLTRALDFSAQRGLSRLLRGVGMNAPMTLFLEGLTSAAAWLAVFFSAYVCVAFILGSFPYTMPWGEALAGNLLRLFEQLGARAVAAIPGILTVAVIFLIARLTTRMLNALLKAVEHDRISMPFLYPDTARATRWLVLTAIWLFALAIAYPHLPGANSAAFQGISVITGLMISVGSAGIVNQAMSGLVLVYSRALIQGDFVKIGEERGLVVSVGPLSTKIETCKGEEITIPNTVVVSSQIKNFSRRAPDKGAAIVTSVSIGYDTSWRQVSAMLTQAARSVSGVQKDEPPYVLQRELAEFYVTYELVTYIDNPEMYDLVLSEIHGKIQDIFNEHEVQIMTPNFRAQPEKKVLVPKERWFAAPASMDRQSEKTI